MNNIQGKNGYWKKCSKYLHSDFADNYLFGFFFRVDVVETSYVPFLVEPAFGTIPAGKTASCIVKFAPLDANDYEGRLICRFVVTCFLLYPFVGWVVRSDEENY